MFPFDLSTQKPIHQDSVLALSFAEIRPTHVQGASFSSPVQSVSDYRGHIVTLPTNMAAIEGLNLVHNLIASSEPTSIDSFVDSGPDPVSISWNTLEAEMGQEGMQISAPSMTFDAQVGKTYGLRVKITLSRELIFGETLILHLDSPNDFEITPNNSDQFLGPDGGYATVFVGPFSSNESNVSWYLEQDGIWEDDLTIQLQEFMVLELPSDNRFPDVPYVPASSGADLGFGSNRAVWLNEDEYGYPLITQNTWIENLVPWSADWTNFRESSNISITDTSGGFFQLTRPNLADDWISYIEKEIIVPAGGSYSLTALLELKASSSDSAVIGIERGLEGIPSDTHSSILFGPGHLVSLDNHQVFVTGLKSNQSTLVRISRIVNGETEKLGLRVYPDNLNTKHACDILIGQVRVTNDDWGIQTPYGFQHPTTSEVELGRFARNQVPNSIMHQPGYNQLPEGWSHEESGVLLGAISTHQNHHVRSLDIRYSGLVPSGSATLTLVSDESTTENIPYYAGMNLDLKNNLFEADIKARLRIEEYDEEDRLLTRHHSELKAVTGKHELYLKTQSDQVRRISLDIEFQFSGQVDCRIRITEPQLVRWATTPTPFVPTSRGPEFRIPVKGLVTDGVTYSFDALGATEARYTLYDLSTHTQFLNSGTVTVPNLPYPVLGVRLLTSSTRLNLIDGEPLGTFESPENRNHVVTDNEGRLWFAKANEIRRIGLNRVEQLLANNALLGTTLPDDWSMPLGLGRFTHVRPSENSTYNKLDLGTNSDNPRAFLEQGVTLEPNQQYTLSVDADYLSATVTNHNLLNVNNPGSEVVDTGNAVSKERSYFVFDSGSDIGVVQIGLGTIGPVPGIQAQLSKPSLTKGHSVGNRRWVDSNLKYNSNVAGVAYYSEDRYNNIISNEKAGVEIIPSTGLWNNYPNELDAWSVHGGSADPVLTNLGDAELFHLQSDGSPSCWLEQDLFLVEGTYTLTLFSRCSWLYVEIGETKVLFDSSNQAVGSTKGSPIVTFEYGTTGHVRTNIQFAVPSMDTYPLKVHIAETGHFGSHENLTLNQSREISWIQVTKGLPGPVLSFTSPGTLMGDSWHIPFTDIRQKLPTFELFGSNLHVEYTWYGKGDEDSTCCVFSLQDTSNPGTYVEYQAATRTFLVYENNVELASHSFNALDQNAVVGRHQLSILITHGNVSLSVDSSPYVELSVTLPSSLDVLNLGRDHEDEDALRGLIRSFYIERM